MNSYSVFSFGVNPSSIPKSQERASARSRFQPRSDQVGDALASVLAQTCNRLEVIVDSGSAVPTEDVIAKIANGNQQPKSRDCPASYEARCRRRMQERHRRGEVFPCPPIAFLDDGDRWEPA